MTGQTRRHRVRAGLRGRLLRGAVLLAGAVILVSTSGCVAVATVLTHEAVTGIGLVSMVTTGKGLADHALDAITHKDCRIVSGLVREERQICEPRGSWATQGDFKGLIGYEPGQEEEVYISRGTASGYRMPGSGYRMPGSSYGVVPGSVYRLPPKRNTSSWSPDD